MRRGQLLRLLAGATALLFAVQAALADGPKLGGTAAQSVSAGFPLDGSAAAFGTATGLSLSLDAGGDQTTFEASLGFSLLSGRESELLWASLKAHPSRARNLILSTAFDPSAEAPENLLLVSLDVLSLRWSGGNFGAEAGLTTANWGVGRAFSPADFFADLDLSSGQPKRLSRLLGRLSWFPSATSRLDLVADPAGPDGPTFASRAYGLLGETVACGAALGLRFPSGAAPRLLGALDLSLDLPLLAPYGELSLSLPTDDVASPTAKAMAGLQARIGDFSLFAEYLFSPEETPIHSTFAAASLPLDDWITLSATAAFLPEYGSGTGGLGLDISEASGLSLSCSASGTRSATGLWTILLGAKATLAF